MIYFIDIQDPSFFDDSINYLSDIISSLNLEFQNLTDSNFKLFILLHKADPDIINSLSIIKNIEFLIS